MLYLVYSVSKKGRKKEYGVYDEPGPAMRQLSDLRKMFKDSDAKFGIYRIKGRASIKYRHQMVINKCRKLNGG